MNEVPTTRYTASGDVHIAYQILGSGPLDLVFVPAAASHLETLWEHPAVARWFRRLAWISRLIMFDKRGTGMSDRIQGTPTLEERMDDVRVVMDAAGSERPAVCGASEGGAIAVLFAATYPERVSSVVAIGSGAVGWRPDPEAQRQIDDYVAEHWGSGVSVSMMAPSVAHDDGVRSWFGKWERLAASPGAAADLLRMNAAFDIRAALPAVSAPTLVIHRTGDLTYRLDQGRDLATGIAGARFVECPGTDHAPWFEDPDVYLDLIEEFVTAERRHSEAERHHATVLFAEATLPPPTATAVGTRAARTALDRYAAILRDEVDEHGGTCVKTSGPATLASFDGPIRALRCGFAVQDRSAELSLELRIGLHSGTLERHRDDVAGEAVGAAQRAAGLAVPGQVIVSDAVRNLVIGSGIDFVELEGSGPAGDIPRFLLTVRPPSPARIEPLSLREAQVVGLVSAGLDNSAIAEKLCVSRRTVDAHLSHVRDKLGLASRIELARWGLERQLAPPPGSPGAVPPLT